MQWKHLFRFQKIQWMNGKLKHFRQLKVNFFKICIFKFKQRSLMIKYFIQIQMAGSWWKDNYLSMKIIKLILIQINMMILMEILIQLLRLLLFKMHTIKSLLILIEHKDLYLIDKVLFGQISIDWVLMMENGYMKIRTKTNIKDFLIQ